MTVKDLAHHVTFTLVFPIWGAVYSGMKRKQTGDVTNSTACQSLFNTLVSSCANLSLKRTVYFFSTFTYSHQESMTSACVLFLILTPDTKEPLKSPAGLKDTIKSENEKALKG